MQQLGKIRYREKRGRPTFISPVLLVPKAAISKNTKAGLLTYSTFLRPSRPSSGQWLTGSKKAVNGANSIG